LKARSRRLHKGTWGGKAPKAPLTGGDESSCRVLPRKSPEVFQLDKAMVKAKLQAVPPVCKQVRAAPSFGVKAELNSKALGPQGAFQHAFQDFLHRGPPCFWTAFAGPLRTEAKDGTGGSSVLSMEAKEARPAGALASAKQDMERPAEQAS